MLKNLHFNEFIRMMSMMKNKIYPYFISMIGSCICYSGFNIVVAYANKQMINGVINSDKALLMNAVIIVSAALLIECAIDPVCVYWFERTLDETMNMIRHDVFCHLERLPISYYEKNHSGDIISRTTNDLNLFNRAYRSGIHMSIRTLIRGLGTAGCAACNTFPSDSAAHHGCLFQKRSHHL